MQKSRSFIFPMMNFNSVAIYENLLNTYMGHVGYEGLDTWGNYFYLEYDPAKLSEFSYAELRGHFQYQTEFDTEEGTLLFVFKFSPEQIEKVITPFLLGKYSQIDRDYVQKYFQQIIENNYSTNWRILHKDNWDIPTHVQPLRDYWKERLGVALPIDAEVWGIPLKRDEIYGFSNYLIHSSIDSYNLEVEL